MKFKALRNYIKSKTDQAPHSLKNCDLVIDGDSYFSDTYKSSGCQYIFGPDCDRYADFLINQLSIFLDSSIKCCVIFRGITKMDLDERKDKYQSIIDKRNTVECYKQNAPYFDPIFVKDVQKQVLEEMGIKYFVCEAVSFEAIVGVARKLRCPVVTNNIEYCLFGVSCIPTNFLVYDKTTKQIICFIYNNELVKSKIGVYQKTPILLTALNESGEYYKELHELIKTEGNIVCNTIQWTKCQKDNVISSVAQKLSTENERKTFEETYKKLQTLLLYPSCHLAVKYFQREKPHGLFKDDKKWFTKGISNGRMALSYIALKKDGVVSGSRYVYDKNKPDAVLAAIDIIAYSHCLLTNSNESDLTFVGRKCDSSAIWEISKRWDTKISNRDVFNYSHKNYSKDDIDTFHTFLQEVLPGYSTHQLLSVPKTCRILVLSLVYYIYKINENFINEAYCILLSYLMLGPVSENIDFYKKNSTNGEVVDKTKYLDCTKMYNELKFLFDKTDVNNFNVGTIHNFCEFQHCLEYMNYLNKMCGEKSIPCTVYQDTYNATFIYNTLMFKNNKDHLMKFLESKFKDMRAFNVYKIIIAGFEECLNAVKFGSKNGVTVFNYTLY